MPSFYYSNDAEAINGATTRDCPYLVDTESRDMRLGLQPAETSLQTYRKPLASRFSLLNIPFWACRHRMPGICGGVGPFQARCRSVEATYPGLRQAQQSGYVASTAPSGRTFQTPHAISALGLGVFLLLSVIGTSLQAQIRLRAELRLMGSDFILTAVAADSSTASRAINEGIKEIQRIEGLISSWDENSETSRINQMAGIQPVVVGQELVQLILRAQKVSTLTGGAFDLTFGPLMRCWPLRDPTFQWPDSQIVLQVRNLVDYRQIEIDEKERTVFLPQKGMQIGFGAIGKGYAANRARAVMQAFGLKGGMVNAGGDLTCWGNDLNQTGWVISISDPRDLKRVHTRLQVDNLAVVTSGDYINFIQHEGTRYSHILDPRTGYPVINMSSVTVICPDAELADALATAVSVLGPSNGLDLLEQLRGVEGLILTGDGQVLRTTGIKNLIETKR